jgi:hypothetical protein
MLQKGKGNFYGTDTFYFRCSEKGTRGGACTEVLGGGTGASHQEKRAGTPLLHGRGCKTFSGNQGVEREGTAVESNQTYFKKRKAGQADGENTQAEKAVSAAKTAEKMPADAQHGPKTVEVLKAAEKVTGEVEPIKTTSVVGEESGEEKAARLQWLLKQLFREVLQENNEAMCREVRESILKEMDYQFRMQEEREDEREAAQIKRDEEHFRRVDELLRKKRGLLWSRDDRKADKKKADKKEAVKESTKEKPKPLQL